MIKVFIDTNIFVGLYYANHNPITIFEDIFKLKSYLILTDQVHDEFVRNRDIQLQSLIKISKNYNLNYPTSSLIRSLKEFADLNKIKKDLQVANTRLIEKLQKMKENKDIDPVFDSFLKLYNDSKITKYERNEAIIRKAHTRKLIGNPPRSNKDTIGDEINWEIILSNVKNDLVIIARDKTYIDHITFLKKEFKAKTNKELFIDENISYALKKIGEIPSDELNKFEEQQLSIAESLAGLQSSSLMETIARMQSSSIAESIAGLQSSSTMESIARMQSSSIAESLAGLQSSSTMETIARMQSSSTMESIAKLPSSDICPYCRNYGKPENNRCSYCGYTYDSE